MPEHAVDMPLQTSQRAAFALPCPVARGIAYLSDPAAVLVTLPSMERIIQRQRGTYRVVLAPIHVPGVSLRPAAEILFATTESQVLIRSIAEEPYDLPPGEKERTSREGAGGEVLRRLDSSFPACTSMSIPATLRERTLMIGARMDPICTAALGKFREQQRGFLAVINGLSDDAMNWRPGAETNSIAVLVAHTWGAAQAWTARAAGTEIERDRDAEFRVVLSAAEAETLIHRAGDRVAMFLGAIDSATYGDDRVDQGGDHNTVAMCLIHAIEHTQEHYGHACLTRQIWEQREA